MGLEFKGTQGPWKVIEGGEWGKYQIIDQRISDEKRSIICEVFDTFDCAQSENANLLASAPELLKALIDLNSAIDKHWNDIRNDNHIKALCNQQRKSLAIILKAISI